jgi:hypothetical protein
VAALWDGRGIAIYLDGRMQGYARTGPPLASFSMAGGSVGSDLGGDLPFDGSISELRVWKHALSGSELERLTVDQRAPLASGAVPIFEWRLEVPDEAEFSNRIGGEPVLRRAS